MENRQLKSIIEALDPRDRSIMYYRFVSRMTLNEIGRICGLSRERVRQCERRILYGVLDNKYSEEDISECLRDMKIELPESNRYNDLGSLIKYYGSAFVLHSITNNPFKLAVRLSGLNKWFNKNKRNISLDSSDIESAIVLLNRAFDNEDLDSLNKGIHILLSNGTDRVYSLRDLFNQRNVDPLLPAAYMGLITAESIKFHTLMRTSLNVIQDVR